VDRRLTAAFPGTQPALKLIARRASRFGVSVPRVTTELTSSVRAAGPILQALVQAGVDFEQLGARLGLDPSVFADQDARVPISKLLPLWEVAEELLNDPFIGLHLAQGASRETYDIFSYIASASANLREATTVTASAVFDQKSGAVAYLLDRQAIMVAFEVRLDWQVYGENLWAPLPSKRVAIDLSHSTHGDGAAGIVQRQVRQVALERSEPPLIDWIDELHHPSVEVGVVKFLWVVHQTVAPKSRRHEPQQLPLPAEEAEARISLVGQRWSVGREVLTGILHQQPFDAQHPTLGAVGEPQWSKAKHHLDQQVFRIPLVEVDTQPVP